MALGGKRPGAGRKKGSVTTKTLEKRKAEEALHGRILSAVDRIFNAQLALAEGTTFLYRIDETGKGKDKTREHVLVTDPLEIKEVLDETDGIGGKLDSTGEYYIITTKNPDNKAIDSMLDRVFGKATNKTEVTGKNGTDLFPIPILKHMTSVQHNNSNPEDSGVNQEN